MIPSISTRIIRLHPPILNRKHIRKNPLLIHRHSEQLPPIARTDPQFLTCSVHRLLLALEVERVGEALLRLVDLPGAVDGPMAEVAGSGEAERARGSGVPEEVADEGWFLDMSVSVRSSFFCLR